VKSGRGGRGSWGRCEGEGGHIVIGGSPKERANQPRIDETYPCRSQMPSMHIVCGIRTTREREMSGAQTKVREMRGRERGGPPKSCQNSSVGIC
jgi:hypothetical protein